MLFSKVGAFVTLDTEPLFHFHFERTGVKHKLVTYTDFDQFVNSQHDRKLVCLQMPFPVDPAFDEQVQNYADNADYVLVLVSELHDRTLEIMQRNDRKNIVYFICGDLNIELAASPVHKFYDWFITTVHFYRNVRPATLDVLDPYTVKPKYFDVLLGRRKVHRRFAFDFLTSMGLYNKNIVTYLDASRDCNLMDTTNDQWIWESEGLDINRSIEWTVERVPYYGHMMSISQILPLTIYNQTAYSIIAETNWKNHYSFYTEKTIKPIIGRRLFVMLGGQYQLRNLKQLGFQSFDSVIDESYDAIEDNNTRFRHAMEQVKYLCEQPQQEILDKIKPIVDHNFNVMMSTDWYDVYFKPAFVSYFNQ